MKKKLTAMLIVLVLLLSVLMPSSVFAADTTIVIAHTNDIHARVFEGDGIGLAKISTLVSELRAANPNTLLMDAGDAFHGQTFATLEKGASIVEVYNLMGYDVMTPGNHDFNYGYERLLELADMADFPILSANVLKENGTALLEPYTVKTVGGVKVGIFGLTTPETTYKTHPDNVMGLTFADPVVKAQAMVTLLESLGCQVIVGLFHLGLDEASVDTSAKVAMEVDGIDVIIDGHSHSTLPQGLVVNNTLIASAGEYDKNLGVVEITVSGGVVTAKTASLITKAETADTVADPAVVALTESINATHDVILSEVVGRSTLNIMGERNYVRTGETNMGNLVTDAMLAESGADVALTNGGGIRASIPAGYITKGDVITVLPFGNYIVTKEVTGAIIKQALEYATDSYPASAGKFPQVGGMSFSIDMNRPVGDRIVDLMIGDMPVNLNAAYVLATNDFMAAGGDGYTMLTTETVNEFKGLDEAVIDYIAAKGVIAPLPEGRITVIEGSYTDTSPTTATNKYTVVAGDNLTKIAAMYGLTWNQLYELNKATIADPDMISIGQVLTTP
ncbi:MAG: 5'-nucleotidase C-terminal domain-containing protein [Clostridia bacterium]|nr:5'-nucleotidase C-terminal domain-containing protein [Clostridia bacterium]